MRNDCHEKTFKATQSVPAHCQETDQVMRQRLPKEIEDIALAQV